MVTDDLDTPRDGNDASFADVTAADQADAAVDVEAAAAAAGHAERTRIGMATLIFSAATFLSRIAGLVREIITAAVFTVGNSYSAFVVANQIPNLLRSLVADSALSAAFVPVFTELRESGDDKRAWKVASAVCSIIVVVLGPLTLLAMVFAPVFVTPFVDATFSPQDVALAIGLVRVLLPIVLILALSGVIVGILNSNDRFGAAALAPVAWNGVILASLAVGVLFFRESWGIWIYAIGTVAGTVVQALMPVPWLRGLGGSLRATFDWRDPKVKEIFVLMLPVTISLGLINLQQLISSYFAAHVDASLLVSGLEAGAGPAVLDKAFRIYMLPQGIFSVAVTTVFFPVLARMVARDDRPGFASTVDSGLRRILILLVPSSVFIGVFALPITRMLYQHGKFGAPQSEAVSLALIAFAIGLTFNGLSLMLIRSFFSLRATWVPTWISLATLVANFVLAALTYRAWGVFGTALATSVANVIGVALLYALLVPRTSGLGTRRTLAVGAGTLGAAVVGVGLAGAFYLGWEHLLGHGFFATFGGVTAALAIA
ncbi:MAG: murein biosynthesis integral membrane protein MurJ, partial [Thermoleophilia bacterium]|nr:murein biosynthesis integral membrane protein MurJ [Thermoleophilia bacterium]